MSKPKKRHRTKTVAKEPRQNPVALVASLTAILGFLLGQAWDVFRYENPGLAVVSTDSSQNALTVRIENQSSGVARHIKIDCMVVFADGQTSVDLNTTPKMKYGDLTLFPGGQSLPITSKGCSFGSQDKAAVSFMFMNLCYLDDFHVHFTGGYYWENNSALEQGWGEIDPKANPAAERYENFRNQRCQEYWNGA